MVTSSSYRKQYTTDRTVVTDLEALNLVNAVHKKKRRPLPFQPVPILLKIGLLILDARRAIRSFEKPSQCAILGKRAIKQTHRERAGGEDDTDDGADRSMQKAKCKGEGENVERSFFTRCLLSDFLRSVIFTSCYTSLFLGRMLLSLFVIPNLLKLFNRKFLIL